MASPPYALSPSSISSFKECPLAFRFSYLDRLPEPSTVWTAKGTLVHLALQYLLDRPADDRTVDAALADLDHDLESGNAPVRGDLLAPNPSSTWGYGASGGRLGRPGP